MAAIVVNGGQLVGQGDWDALAAQHGGVKGTATLRAPTEAEIKAGAMAGDDDPSGQQRPIYRYYFADGSYVEARTAPNGADYQIVAYQPSSQFTRSQTASTPSGPKEWRTEGRPDGNGGFDNSRPIMAAYVNGQRTGETREPTGKELEDWNEAQQRSRNPGGKTDREVQDEKDKADARARADADRNRPQTTIRENPDGTVVSVQTFPDGTVKTAPVPGVTGKPATVTVDGTVYERKPDGTYAPVIQSTKDDFPTEPAGAPTLDMTPGRVAQGLQAYSAWLATQVELHRNTNGAQGISPLNASKLMDRRIAIAEHAGRESSNLASQQQGILNSQITQRGQSLSETASRRGDANTAYTNNLQRFVPQMSMMGAGGGQLVANAMGASLAANQAYVDQWGGFREALPVETPTFLGQIRNASMQGIQTAASGGPVLTGAAGTPPAPPPSAAELEAQRQATMAQHQAAMAAAAGSPAAPPQQQPPPPPPAISPINEQPITPPPVPDPNVGQPGDSISPPVISPSTGEPTGLGPLPENGQFPGQMPPAAPVNAKPDLAPAERPTFLPPAPVDMPGDPGSGYNPSNASQTGPIDPYTGLPRMSMTPSFLSQARYGVAYNPYERGLALGIRPDILELALAG